MGAPFLILKIRNWKSKTTVKGAETMTKPRAQEIAVLITATLLILGSWVVFGWAWLEVFR